MLGRIDYKIKDGAFITVILGWITISRLGFC